MLYYNIIYDTVTYDTILYFRLGACRKPGGDQGCREMFVCVYIYIYTYTCILYMIGKRDIPQRIT